MSVWLLMVEPWCVHNRLGNLTILVTKTSQHSAKSFVQATSVRGPQVAQFEREFAARHGVKHAISVTSGTAAMHVCIGAINPDPGDEIIVSPWTAGGSFIGALLHNCVPVFADIDDTFTLDPKDVEAKITPRTRAIIAVHLFGNPCNMAALREIAQRHQPFLD